eukprot:COSAG06_NODE_1619_length_8908_cov_3.222727_5_plen_136_part_00
MHGLCAVCYASQGSPEAELTLVFLIEKALGHNSASHTESESEPALLCLSNVNTAQSVGSLCHEHRPDAALCCAVLCYAVDMCLLTRGRQVEGQSRRQEEAAAAAQGQEEGQQERRLCRRRRRWRRRARSSSLCAE